MVVGASFGGLQAAQLARALLHLALGILILRKLRLLYWIGVLAARVEPAVRDLDIVSHLGSFRCLIIPCPRLPGPAPSRSLAIFYRFTVEEAIENGDRAYAGA